VDTQPVETVWKVLCKVRKPAGEQSEREWFVYASLRGSTGLGFPLNLPNWLFADGRGVFLEEVAGTPYFVYVNTVENMSN
jgi:hypothetical protein